MISPCAFGIIDNAFSLQFEGSRACAPSSKPRDHTHAQIATQSAKVTLSSSKTRRCGSSLLWRNPRGPNRHSKHKNYLSFRVVWSQPSSFTSPLKRMSPILFSQVLSSLFWAKLPLTRSQTTPCCLMYAKSAETLPAARRHPNVASSAEQKNCGRFNEWLHNRPWCARFQSTLCPQPPTGPQKQFSCKARRIHSAPKAH